jgi:exodeoxyribonuclease VII large subunit
MGKERETFNDRPVYSLSEICGSIKSVINKIYTRAYYVKAEIIRLNRYPYSGHCYPELVEKEGDKIVTQMRGVIWKTQVDAINEKFMKITGEVLKDNIRILCLATIEFSAQYGLALYIQDIEPSYTLGELMKNKMAVIARLKEEGVFEANKRLPLPLLPKRVAVISVETSKGYSDFMVTLKENNWGYCFECKLFPSILQGEKAIGTITSQLDAIAQRQQDFDCVVIIRGGGGDVGLSCYDDYSLAHKVATFPLPIISGIGHSTNESVTDMVSYANKITPTEVAYFLIQQFHNFAIQVEEAQEKMVHFLENFFTREKHLIEQIEHSYQLTASRLLSQEKHQIEQLEHRYQLLSKALITQEKSQLENLYKMMLLSAKQLFVIKNKELENLEEKIKLLHPEQVLKRGYSITRLNGKAITDASTVKAGDQLVTTLHQGEVTSVVS